MLWNWLRKWLRRDGPKTNGHDHISRGMDPDHLKMMVRGILSTRPDEIGCDECFELLDQFVELKLAGKDAAAAMPLVEDHLQRCGDCREEFEALLAALRALSIS
ncbi:MAG: hypothetical protein Kow0047_01230 [Anaerolineae bacterium]